jgi:Mg2+/Co2+ transporter CorC
MSEERPGSSGSWLRRLAESLTGEPRDLEQLTDVLEDARDRGLIDADVLAMLEVAGLARQGFHEASQPAAGRPGTFFAHGCCGVNSR